MALAIQSRLAVLRNANNLFSCAIESVLFGSINSSGRPAGAICSGPSAIHKGLSSSQIMTQLQRREEGGIDRDKVTAITIIEVTDYH